MPIEFETRPKIDSVQSEYVPFLLLTKREQQVLQCKANGFGNEEIAKILGIAKNTVEAHVHSIANIALEGGSGFARNHEYPNQTRITFIGLIQDGIANGYLSHDLTDLQIQPLTKRENEVVELVLAIGKSHQDIADYFVLSVKTVETHINHIHKKLKTRNIYHLVARLTYLKLNSLWPEPMD